MNPDRPSARDQKAVIKSAQTADLLMQDLRSLMATDNTTLHVIASYALLLVADIKQMLTSGTMEADRDAKMPTKPRPFDVAAHWAGVDDEDEILGEF